MREKPKKEDYLTCNQFEYDTKLSEYYKALEKYVEYLESLIKDNKLHDNSYAEYIHNNEANEIDRTIEFYRNQKDSTILP